MQTFKKLPTRAPNAAVAAYHHPSIILSVHDLPVQMNPYGQ
jgi:hypothetical protein